MENGIWEKFIQLVKSSVREKFKIFFPGCIIGLLGAKSLLFSGLPTELVTFGAYCLKFVGTVLMAFGSGLGTTAGARWIEQLLEKKRPSGPNENGRKDKAA